VTETARRAYLALGRGFVLVGLAIAALAIADAVASLGFFQGSPLGTAVFLALIGAALLWTVRQADAQRAAEEVEDASAVAPEDAGEEPEDDRA
jgi:hypothetical protein